MYKEIKKCRICKSSDFASILSLGSHVLSGRFPHKDEPDPPKAPLELIKCQNCGLLQLKHTVNKDELYMHEYGYRSGVNNTMTAHLLEIVNTVRKFVDFKADDVVLDIGSNDATLLKYYTEPGLVRIGIDPTINQFKEYYPDNIVKVNDYFSSSVFFKSSPNKKAKVITSIALFYDLEHPLDFAEDVKNILEKDGIWVLEQSYMPFMLEQNSFDTICHEHLEYYSLKQIDWIVREKGLRIFNVEFSNINGGSFRVYVCHEKAPFQDKGNKLASIFQKEKTLQLDTLNPYKEFVIKIEEIRKKITDIIQSEKAKGKKIYIYGASTKGNTILQFCHIDNSTIVAAADRNPKKWGRHTPGTNIPIISEEEARKNNPDYFLVLPWHFKEEFLKREQEFLKKGGKFIFPLPEFEVISSL